MRTFYLADWRRRVCRVFSRSKYSNLGLITYPIGRLPS